MPSSRFALRCTVAAAALALIAAAAPAAAKKADDAAAAAAANTPDAKNISKAVRPFLMETQKLEAAGDNAGALAQLRSAEATGALNDTDKFYIAQLKLGLGNKLKDNAALEEGIKASVASPFLPASEKPKYIGNLAALALQRNDYNAAMQYMEELTAMPGAKPADFDTLGDLYSRQKQTPQAIATYEKEIAAATAAGQLAPETTYQKRLQLAYDGKNAAASQAASMDLVKAYPTPTNWRNVLYIYREFAKVDDQGNLDTLRLMQTVGALGGERDYAEFTELLLAKALPGEAKAVVADGVAKGMLAPGKGHLSEYNKEIAAKVASDRAALPGYDKDARAAANGKAAMGQGDAYFGYGEYTKAAEMYRLALSKGGVDAATANLRLGASLMRGGDKAAAKAAFEAVQGGTRAPLAQYWLIALGKA